MCINPNRATVLTISYLLDTLATRVVVPLVRGLAARRLNPTFNINDSAAVMSTAELAGVSFRALGDKVILLTVQCDEIIAVLDLLFAGIQ